MADAPTAINRAWPSALNKTRSRLSRRNDVTALDIDQRMLRVVHVTTGKIPGSTHIKRIEVVPVPSEGFDLENPRKVGEWIGEQLKALRLVPGNVVMAARRGEAVLKELLLPSLKDAGEMASMVNMRAVRELPFPEADAVIDFTVTKAPTKKELQTARKETQQPGAATDTKAHIVVAAVRRNTVNRYLTITESAGLTLTGLGLRPLASFRALKACVPEINSNAVALISVRRHEVDVDILIDGRLVFSRELSVNLEKPEDVIEAVGQDCITKAAKEIIRCLHSYEGSEAFKPMDHLFIAGGTGLEDTLRDIIRDQTGIDCKRMPPPTGVRLPKGRETDATRALTALGLALGFVDERGLAVNFLAPKRPELRRNRGRTMWLLSIVMLQVLVFFLFGARSKLAEEFEEELSGSGGLISTYSTLTKQEKDIGRWTRRSADTIKSWHGANRHWLEHVAFLSSVIPQCDQIYLLKINMRSANTGVISFQVQVRDSNVLHSFEKKLRNLGYIVKPVSFTPANDKYGYKFRATFDLTLPDRFPLDLLRHLDTNTPPKRLPDDVHADGLSCIPRQKGTCSV
ncbi:MAG: pilus assembly protein PilM [Verrucomicrobiota bacterium]|jgi:Tfp pilus assembly PilM family ATPase|nr:pilus assembly protein PilM [Verrucomicrobiota bacterium]